MLSASLATATMYAEALCWALDYAGIKVFALNIPMDGTPLIETWPDVLYALAAGGALLWLYLYSAPRIIGIVAGWKATMAWPATWGVCVVAYLIGLAFVQFEQETLRIFH